jgi:hypothetical protein
MVKADEPDTVVDNNFCVVGVTTIEEIAEINRYIHTLILVSH